MAKIILEISDCTKCPKFKIENERSNGFFIYSDYLCGELDKFIKMGVLNNSCDVKPMPIPNNCPLLLEPIKSFEERLNDYYCSLLEKFNENLNSKSRNVFEFEDKYYLVEWKNSKWTDPIEIDKY